jgi:glycosyltransferase involved in cell wall biosynthesis
LARVGIFYHTDPAGNVPSGIDSFIRGILQWAPPDLEYSLYGATSDSSARPTGQEAVIRLGEREVRYFPLLRIDAAAARGVVPLTIQYMRALSPLLRSNHVRALDVLDFHRIEPSYLFRHDGRPKNLVLHQDMSVIRDKNSDIKWRYLPWAYEMIERKLFRDMDRIFCVRESAVSRYTSKYPLMANKFAFIPTWVDTSTFKPLPPSAAGVERRVTCRKLLGLGNGTQVLVFVGRLDRQKDPLLLLEAFKFALAQNSNLHLVIVGDGVLRSKVEAASLRDELRGRVTLTGVMSREGIAELLASSDLFVMSSAYEGMPIAALEALAVGLPIVSTDVGELGRVVQDGVNGYLSKSRSWSALSGAILQALSRLSEMRGRACEASVVPYHPEKVLSQIYENHRRQTVGIRS